MSDLEKLRADCYRLYDCKSITDSIELMDVFAGFLFSAIKDRKKDKAESKAEFEARMVFQMMLTKSLHLKSIVNGVSFTSQDGDKLNNIIDPTIVACLVRNLFETVCMFNIVYRQPKTNDEKTILYFLWVHAGLAYRQGFASSAKSEESKKKLEYDKEHMSSIVKEIHDTPLYKQLSEKSQKKIKTRLEGKEYLLTFDEKEIKCLVWHNIPEIMGVRAGLMNEIYNYFSLNSHPSNVSVFQFADMFKKGSEAFPQLTNFNLKYYFALTSIFIADYITLFPETKEIFEKLSIRDQIVINHHNTLLRGKDFSINDSWKNLKD